MKRLDAACERLEKAVARLEAAAARQAAGSERRIEEDLLAEELERVRTRCRELEGATDTVAARLDATIARLQRLLQG